MACEHEAHDRSGAGQTVPPPPPPAADASGGSGGGGSAFGFCNGGATQSSIGGGGEDALSAALAAAGNAGSSAVGGHTASGYSHQAYGGSGVVVPGAGTVPNYDPGPAEDDKKKGKKDKKDKKDKKGGTALGDTDGLKAAFISNERQGSGQ